MGKESPPIKHVKGNAREKEPQPEAARSKAVERNQRSDQRRSMRQQEFRPGRSPREGYGKAELSDTSTSIVRHSSHQMFRLSVNRQRCQLSLSSSAYVSTYRFCVESPVCRENVSCSSVKPPTSVRWRHAGAPHAALRLARVHATNECTVASRRSRTCVEPAGHPFSACVCVGLSLA